MNILTKRGTLDNIVTYEHICDTKADLANIQKTLITLGSVAIVIEDESKGGGLEAYIANSNKEWFPLIGADGDSSSSLGISAHICTSGEYDVSTGVPIIENPDENTFYFTPTGESEPNLYNEYIYIDDKWEKFGTGSVSATVHADWEQYTQSNAAYIDNKPTMVAAANNNSIVANRTTKNANAGLGSFAANTSTATGAYSFAEGYATASAESAHAEGDYSQASGTAAHAEGGMTNASGIRSHAEGDNSDATNRAAHAEGSHTTASGFCAHSEGDATTASASGAHAEGYHSVASGSYSHAEGDGTIAAGRAQHVIGSYNVADTIPSTWSSGTTYNSGDEVLYLNIRYICLTDSLTSNTTPNSDTTNWQKQNFSSHYVEIVGAGTIEDARANIRTLDWEGNETLAGKLTVSSAGITIGSTTITEAQLQALLATLQ